MPTSVSVIDALTTPPLATLQQVLDTNGPYSAGDYRLTDFVTNGAFLLPAGTYSVSGTYGVIVQVNGAFPAFAGYTLGWVDPLHTMFGSGESYQSRIAQINLIHFLPITGVGIITETHDMHRNQEAYLWPAMLGSAAHLGLYVAPNWSVDLFYLCVL